jgi:putative multiple sugar transport system permease protein
MSTLLKEAEVAANSTEKNTNRWEFKMFSVAINKYAMFIALVVISIFFQVLTDGVLLAPMNISKLVMQNSYLLILAIGMLPCILTGDIDLAVGSVVALVGAIAGTLIVSMGLPVGLTIVVCLAVGLLIGAWQGYWVAFVRVPAFIVTLAGMLLFRGATMVILNGNTLAPFPETYQFIAQKFLQDIPVVGAIPFSTVLIGILVAAVGAYLEWKSYRQKMKYGIPVSIHHLSYNRFSADIDWLFLCQPCLL